MLSHGPVSGFTALLSHTARRRNLSAAGASGCCSAATPCKAADHGVVCLPAGPLVQGFHSPRRYCAYRPRIRVVAAPARRRAPPSVASAPTRWSASPCLSRRPRTVRRRSDCCGAPRRSSSPARATPPSHFRCRDGRRSRGTTCAAGCVQPTSTPTPCSFTHSAALRRDARSGCSFPPSHRRCRRRPPRCCVRSPSPRCRPLPSGWSSRSPALRRSGGRRQMPTR